MKIKELKEIDPKYLPSRLPISSSAITWLLLDRFESPEWVWGFAGAFILILWIGSAFNMWRSEWVKPKDI